MDHKAIDLFRTEAEKIQASGLWKDERVLESAQGARIRFAGLFNAAAVFVDTELVPSAASPKNPRSSTTMSLVDARKVTACWSGPMSAT